VTSAVIDVHHHMLGASLAAELEAVGVTALGGEAIPRWRAEDSLEVMDRYAIDVAILSVPVPLQFGDAAKRRAVARALNETAAETVARWPNRFGFFATLPLPDVDAALAELRFAFDELHAKGVAVLTNHGGVYQGDARFDELYAELDRRAAVVFIHPTVFCGDRMPQTQGAGSPIPTLQPSLLEFAFDTTRAVANLVIAKTLDRFPRIRFIVTHSGACVPSVAHRLVDRAPLVRAYRQALAEGGMPPPVEELASMLRRAERDALASVRRFFFDTALSTSADVLASLTGLVPTSQLLLGTDYPMGQEIGLYYTLDGLEAYAGFGEADRRRIKADTAQAILGWGPACHKEGADG
jgi:6-methylsalicylate decarboxylase